MLQANVVLNKKDNLLDPDSGGKCPECQPCTHFIGGLPHIMPEMPVVQHDTLNKQPQIFLQLLQQNSIVFTTRKRCKIAFSEDTNYFQNSYIHVRALPVQVPASSVIPVVGLFQIPASSLKQRHKRCMIRSKLQVQYHHLWLLQ